MKLGDYFRKERINQKDFSKKYHFQYGYIRMIACEAKIPSLTMAIQISMATKGVVTPFDFLPGKVTNGRAKDK
jgi:hypothetical protein